ncbi:hypothetical protein LUZ60_007406 [Juncus effusus]|nr:hypothetical protein LUZ60_007406 [Juncus effusus]
MALSLSTPNSSCFYSRTTTTSRFGRQDRPAFLSNERRTFRPAFFAEVQKRLSLRPKRAKITMMSLGLPRVYYEDPISGVKNFLDVFEALQKERVVFITERIEEEMANQFVATLLFLDEQDSSTDLHFFINCQGGDVSSSMAIYDAMKYIKSEVRTRCFGYAYDISGFILAAGKKGSRTALPHSHIMLRPPIGESNGQVDDVVNETSQLLGIRDRLFKKLAEHTGQPEQKIFEDLTSGKEFNAQEAIEYGIIDEIAKKASGFSNDRPGRKEKIAPGLG